MSTSAGARVLVSAALAVALGLAALLLVPGATAQDAPRFDGRLAGLEWTFARVRYSSWNTEGFRARYWSDPWAIDAPAAEQNLARRLRSVTNIQVNDPIVITIEDPDLFKYPWLYMVEPGNLRLTDQEVPILREFLLRGGTLVMDDFHGPFEFANVEQEMRRVFPERTIVDLPNSHPVFHCFYDLEEYPQIPGLGSFFVGRTWEKGGFTAKLRAITDDTDRPMVLMNWNTDMGDGWEWSNAQDYPGYIKHTAESYRMMINEIVYTLTH